MFVSTGEMSGDSNNAFQDPFAGILDADMEQDPLADNCPILPTTSSEHHSDQPLQSPSVPPPETPAANPRELDRVAEEPTEVELKFDPVVADRGRGGRAGPHGRGRARGRGRRSGP